LFGRLRLHGKILSDSDWLQERGESFLGSAPTAECHPATAIFGPPVDTADQSRQLACNAGQVVFARQAVDALARKPMNAGSAQEIRLIQYLKAQGYRDILHGEDVVKKDLGLPAGQFCKCADAIGFLPAKKTCHQVVVAESKGTDVAKAILQLGNSAAGVLNTYGQLVEVRLLLYRSGLKQLRGVGLSPGHGYLVRATPDPTLHELLDATSDRAFPARAKCELAEDFSRWNNVLRNLTIEVCVE
jgi:hypothetical protein